MGLNVQTAVVNSTVALLDATLDDMADMPSWTKFPLGVYKVKPSVSIEKDKPNKNKIKETLITITAVLLEVRELNDPTAAAPEIGAETSCRFTWENEYGQANLKKLLAPIATITKQTKVTELLETLNAADSVLLVMGIRTVSKEGKPDAEYQSFDDLIVE